MFEKKYILLCASLIIFFSHGISGDSSSTNDSQKHNNSDGNYFYFYYDFSNNREILKSIPMRFSLSTETSIVLDSILKILSINYFRNYNDIYTNTKIELQLIGIDSIKTQSKVYKVAIININDSNNYCLTSFFQGSTGAGLTYNLLGVNLLQPQSGSSFIDGVIILYNGSPLSESDHINLKGILVPKEFYNKAKDAIQKRK